MLSAMSIAVPWELLHPCEMMLKLNYDLVRERQAEHRQMLLCVIAPLADRLKEILPRCINKLSFQDLLASIFEICGNIYGGFEASYSLDAVVGLCSGDELEDCL